MATSAPIPDYAAQNQSDVDFAKSIGQAFASFKNRKDEKVRQQLLGEARDIFGNSKTPQKTLATILGDGDFTAADSIILREEALAQEQLMLDNRKVDVEAKTADINSGRNLAGTIYKANSSKESSIYSTDSTADNKQAELVSKEKQFVLNFLNKKNGDIYAINAASPQFNELLRNDEVVMLPNNYFDSASEGNDTLEVPGTLTPAVRSFFLMQVARVQTAAKPFNELITVFSKASSEGEQAVGWNNDIADVFFTIVEPLLGNLFPKNWKNEEAVAIESLSKMMVELLTPLLQGDNRVSNQDAKRIKSLIGTTQFGSTMQSALSGLTAIATVLGEIDTRSEDVVFSNNIWGSKWPEVAVKHGWKMRGNPGFNFNGGNRILDPQDTAEDIMDQIDKGLENTDAK